MFIDHPIAFTDGYLPFWSDPSKKKMTWDIYQFRCEILEKKNTVNFREFKSKMKSDDISFANATWNLFASYVYGRIDFGIEVRAPSDAVFACNCNISCEDGCGETIKKMESAFVHQRDDVCKIICSLSYCEFDGSGNKVEEFLKRGAFIVCEISVKKWIRKACSQAEISHSSRSTKEEVPIKLPKNEEEDLSTTSFDGKVCQDLKNLLLSEEFSDVTIKIGDKQFKAHWSILAARSPVFASMLRHDTKEKATGVVDVEDCEPSSFPVFLEYVYCESTEKISSENVFNLYVSADKYDVRDLKRKCQEFMMSNLSVDTFCETFRLSLQHSDTKLLKLATEFFIRNLLEIILTPKWQAFISENPIQGNELFIKAAKTFK